MQKALLFFLIGVLISSCGDQTGEGGDLKQAKWKLFAFAIRNKVFQPKGEEPITLQFKDDGQLSGHAGCNEYFGSYSGEEPYLQISRIGSTERYCEGRMQEERLFLDLLQSVKSYTAKNGKLLLLCEDGSMSFSAMEEDSDSGNGGEKGKGWRFERTENTMEGEFAYMADAAVFIDCQTKQKIPVAFQGNFKEMESAYLKAVGPEAGKLIYSVIEGEKQSKRAASVQTIIPKKVISMTREANCSTKIERYAGMFAYMGDAGVFVDCASRKKYPVMGKGANVLLEDLYRKTGVKTGQNAYAEVEGFIYGEGKSTTEMLLVTNVLGVEAGLPCR